MQRLDLTNEELNTPEIDETALLKKEITEKAERDAKVPPFITVLRVTEESEKLNYIENNTEAALVKPMLTMFHLSPKNRIIFADKYVTTENIAEIARAFNSSARKKEFVNNHSDLVSAKNLAALALLFFEDRLTFYQRYSRLINAENIYVIVSSLTPLDCAELLTQHADLVIAENLAALAGYLLLQVRYQFFLDHQAKINATNIHHVAVNLGAAECSVLLDRYAHFVMQSNLAPLVSRLHPQSRLKFCQEHHAHIDAANIYSVAIYLTAAEIGVLLSQHTDKLNEKNFANLREKLSLTSLNLAEHVKFIQAVLPLLEKIDRSLLKNHFITMHRELKNNIKAHRRGVLLLDTTSHQHPFEAFKDLLATAQAVLAIPSFVVRPTDELESKQPPLHNKTSHAYSSAGMGTKTIASSTTIILGAITETNTAAKSSQPSVSAANPPRALWRQAVPHLMSPSRSRVVPSTDGNGVRIFDSPRPLNTVMRKKSIDSGSNNGDAEYRAFRISRNGTE